MRGKPPEMWLPGTFMAGSFTNPAVGGYQPVTMTTLYKDDLGGAQLGSFDAIVIRRTGLYLLFATAFGPVEAGYEREFFITNNGNRTWPHKWNASANQATYETLVIPSNLTVGDRLGITILAYTATNTFTFYLGAVPMRLAS